MRSPATVDAGVVEVVGPHPPIWHEDPWCLMGPVLEGHTR
jgi:hypothetical protein